MQVETSSAAEGGATFSAYQKRIVAILAILQFTVILDFMILSPLGAILMPALHITAGQFGLVVSAYAFSAGAAGLLSAGFADRFDRKKLLLFFYGGFIVGTLLCGIAPTYQFLMAARVVTGFFGGVIGSIVFAITTDLFPLSMRGRVMGVVQTAFSASQILGIPAGLFLSNRWGWHAPFMLIVAFGALLGGAIVVWLRPVDAHLKMSRTRGPFEHLVETVSNPRYLQAFATTALLSIGGFMLMPFGSAFSVRNLGIDVESLPLLYLVTGLFSMAAGPLAGKASDSIGKLKTFVFGSLVTLVMVIVYTHLGVTPIGLVMVVSVVMFAGVSARMVSSQALISAIPAPSSRGSFMSVGSSIQQISGGIAAALAGWIVFDPLDGGPLQHFDTVGFVIVGATVVTMILMALISREIARTAPAPVAAAASAAQHPSTEL